MPNFFICYLKSNWFQNNTTATSKRL